jgi:signal peptidase II
MGSDAQQGSGLGTSMLGGSLTRLGLAIVVAIAALDQASKLWLLYVFDLHAKVPVRLAPFLDLVLVWNKGISYGLFQQQGGQWLLLALQAGAVALLLVWLAHAGSRLTAVALGLIIGGAVGNAIDRLVHGAVADFVLFHITTESIKFSWYVFNLADAAIVAGVVGLLYDSMLGDRAAKAPRSPT